MLVHYSQADWMIDFFGKFNTRIDEKGDEQIDFENSPGLKLYVFEKTPKISTYLFALAAGTYKVSEEPAQDTNYPHFRLLMRNNLKSPLTVEEVSIIVKQAISNYENLFGIKYPFAKLDFVMCPEFKYGGMENVGCICYSENHFV